MDIGCELHGYVSDLTRTWPPCGNFSAAQVFNLYPIVLFIYSHYEDFEPLLVCVCCDLKILSPFVFVNLKIFPLNRSF